MGNANLLAVFAVAAINHYFTKAFAPPHPRAFPSSIYSAPPNSAESAPTTTTVASKESTNTETATYTNVGFEDWIADAPKEVTEWRGCQVEGTIPSYVQGTLIRNGCGIWSTENGEMYSHVFDGLAKIHAYRIHSSKVEHMARFLESSWYNEYTKSNKQKLPHGIGIGPVLDANEEAKSGLLTTLQATLASAKFDNAPVNIWDWTPNIQDPAKKRVTALTDAPPRTTIDFDTMDTLSSSAMNTLAEGARGFEMLITSHPLYNQNKQSSATSVESYNVAVELGLNGPTVNLIKETSEGRK